VSSGSEHRVCFELALYFEANFRDVRPTHLGVRLISRTRIRKLSADSRSDYQIYLQNNIRQMASADMCEGPAEEVALARRRHVRNNDDQPRVQLFFPIECGEIRAIVRNEHVVRISYLAINCQSFRPLRARKLM